MTKITEKEKNELHKRKYLSAGVQLGPTIEVESHEVETFSYNYTQELKEYINDSHLDSISKLIVLDTDFSGTQLRIDCTKEDIVSIIMDISNIEHCFPKYIETIDDYFIVNMEFTRGRLGSGHYSYIDKTLKVVEDEKE